MIEEYIEEFFLSPKTLSNKKVTYIKNYFYPEINQFKKIKRENFQVGVNSNKNKMFFRDKTNKHEEIILHLGTKKKINNFRKNVSFTIYDSNSFQVININNANNANNSFQIIDNNFQIETSKDNLIKYDNSPKYSKKCYKCIIF